MAIRRRVHRQPDARVERARALLGDEAQSMTDAEVLEVIEEADAVAHIIVRMYLDSQRSERPM
jgi:hypothetical protein